MSGDRVVHNPLNGADADGYEAPTAYPDEPPSPRAFIGRQAAFGGLGASGNLGPAREERHRVGMCP